MLWLRWRVNLSSFQKSLNLASNETHIYLSQNRNGVFMDLKLNTDKQRRSVNLNRHYKMQKYEQFLRHLDKKNTLTKCTLGNA